MVFRLDVRLSYAARILKYIHFKEISRRKLNAILDKVFEGGKYELQLYKIILKEVYVQSSPRETAGFMSDLLNSR